MARHLRYWLLLYPLTLVFSLDVKGRERLRPDIPVCYRHSSRLDRTLLAAALYLQPEIDYIPLDEAGDLQKFVPALVMGGSSWFRLERWQVIFGEPLLAASDADQVEQAFQRIEKERVKTLRQVLLQEDAVDG